MRKGRREIGRLSKVLHGLGQRTELVTEIAGIVGEVTQAVIGGVQTALQNEDVQRAISKVKEAGQRTGDGAEEMLRE